MLPIDELTPWPKCGWRPPAMHAATMIRGNYDYGLVVLSVALAILVSYAALDLAGRITSSHGRARTIWLTAGATAMGVGIWAMHYVGMLALKMPMPVYYHLPTVMLSLLAAIGASGVALFVAGGGGGGGREAGVGQMRALR